MKKRQYSVSGMTCAACVARVEKAVRAVDGVEACTVSLLTQAMRVEGDAPAEQVIEAVVAAGYGATLKGTDTSSAAREQAISTNTESPRLLRRLLCSLGFLLLLMYLSMGHGMMGFPLPHLLEENPLAVGLIQMLLAAVVLLINQKFFKSGIRSVLHGGANMDTLVALGAGVSFGYSVAILFEMTGTVMQGNALAAKELLHGLYFESAAMIVTLITLGKLLEARAKGKTTDALRALIKLAPQTAIVLRDGEEKEISVEEVLVGDVFLLYPGMQVPVDGMVLEGESAVNESALTGESLPVDKTVGDSLFAATVNTFGFLRCKATRVGEDTALSQIVEVMSEAAATKAPIAKIADRVSGVFVPAVLGVSAITLAVWLFADRGVGFALARAISVLVISCPCALGLATPVAIMVGNGVGARNGILFKTASALEAAGRIDTVVLDKTGTVTTGHPTVVDVIAVDGRTEDDLMRLAYSIEKQSEHPLARAVVEAARERGLDAEAVERFSALTGSGVRAEQNGKPLLGGNLALMRENGIGISVEIEKAYADLAGEGKTPLFFAFDGTLWGLIAVADEIRTDAAQAVLELKAMGLSVVMLTGDNEATANAIGKRVGVDTVISHVLPTEKELVIRRLQERGRVAMVGDGINDAPALTRADVGIAIGAGSDIAIDAADVVLVHSRVADIPAALRLSKATLRNIRENLFWAFLYNTIGIPVAAGVFIPLIGLTLHPMFGAAAMSLSSFCVVMNALRLNLFPLRNPKKFNRSKRTVIETDFIQKEKKTMEKIIRVEGMMCPHCEAHVKKALEAIEGVAQATASHTEGCVRITLQAPVSDAVCKQAIEAAGYTVIE